MGTEKRLGGGTREGVGDTDGRREGEVGGASGGGTKGDGTAERDGKEAWKAEARRKMRDGGGGLAGTELAAMVLRGGQGTMA